MNTRVGQQDFPDLVDFVELLHQFSVEESEGEFLVVHSNVGEHGRLLWEN